MKAYQVVENGKPLEEKEMETPVPTGKEILLKTISCGVCHSDVHIHDGYFDLGGDMKLPMPLAEPLTMGHEIFGEVIAKGDEVTSVSIGDRYVAYPWIGCGDCELCNSDKTHYCLNNSNLDKRSSLVSHHIHLFDTRLIKSSVYLTRPLIAKIGTLVEAASIKVVAGQSKMTA
mgnify:CR=1 FL=1